MKLGELFEIGKKIWAGEEVNDFKINRRDPQTIEYIAKEIDLESRYIDCGIISCNPEFYKCTAKTRRQYIGGVSPPRDDSPCGVGCKEGDVFIALIRLSGSAPPMKGLKTLEEVRECTPEKDTEEVKSLLYSFIEKATKNEDSKHITTIDLLLAYNGYAKEKLTRNKLEKELKATGWEMGQCNINGRQMKCLKNRTWDSEFI
jgi:hypothetical protein